MVSRTTKQRKSRGPRKNLPIFTRSATTIVKTKKGSASRTRRLSFALSKQSPARVPKVMAKRPLFKLTKLRRFQYLAPRILRSLRVLRRHKSFPKVWRSYWRGVRGFRRWVRRVLQFAKMVRLSRRDRVLLRAYLAFFYRVRRLQYETHRRRCRFLRRKQRRQRGKKKRRTVVRGRFVFSIFRGPRERPTQKWRRLFFRLNRTRQLFRWSKSRGVPLRWPIVLRAVKFGRMGPRHRKLSRAKHFFRVRRGFKLKSTNPVHRRITKGRYHRVGYPYWHYPFLFQFAIRRLGSSYFERLPRRILTRYIRLARRRYRFNLRLALGRLSRLRSPSTLGLRFTSAQFRRSTLAHRRLTRRLGYLRRYLVKFLYSPRRKFYRFSRRTYARLVRRLARRTKRRYRKLSRRRRFVKKILSRSLKKPLILRRRKQVFKRRALTFVRWARLARLLRKLTRRRNYGQKPYRIFSKYRVWLRRNARGFLRRKPRFGFPSFSRQLNRHYRLYRTLLTFSRRFQRSHRRYGVLLGLNAVGFARRPVLRRWAPGAAGTHYCFFRPTRSFLRRISVPRFDSVRRYRYVRRLSRSPLGNRLYPWLRHSRIATKQHHLYVHHVLRRVRMLQQFYRHRLILRIPKWRRKFRVRRRRLPRNLFRRSFRYGLRQRKRRLRRYRSYLFSARFKAFAVRYGRTLSVLRGPIRLRKYRRLRRGLQRLVRRLLRPQRHRYARRSRLARRRAQRRYVRQLRFIVRKPYWWRNRTFPKLGPRSRRAIRIRQRRYGSLRRKFTPRLRRKRRLRKKFRRFRRKYFRVSWLRRRWRLRWKRRRRVKVRKLSPRMSSLLRSRRAVIFYMKQVTNNFFYSIFYRRRLLATFSNGRTEFVGSRRTSGVACESAAKRIALMLAANRIRGIFFIFDSKFNYFKRTVMRIFRTRRFQILGCKYQMRRAHGFKARRRASRRV